MRSTIAFWPTMTLPTSAFSLSMKADCLWTSSLMTRTSMAARSLQPRRPLGYFHGVC